MHRFLPTFFSTLLAPGLMALFSPGLWAADPEQSNSILATENLVAWCIVPFDALERTPVERAKMLRALGMRRLAYDWREKHIPTFDQEIAAMRKHGIEISAFWLWLGTLEPDGDSHAKVVLDTLRRNQLKTQIWISFDDRNLMNLDQAAKVAAVSAAILPIARQAQAIGCRVGLYNHGGWFGDPDNQLEVIALMNQPNVGLVYNFHHAHRQIDRFAGLLRRMMPHLLAINLNGMRPEGPKILPIGAGESEQEMIATIQASGYEGLIGILDHRDNVDAEKSLRENLAGLTKLRRNLPDAGGGKEPR